MMQTAMTSNPTVSVLISAYNHERYIEACVRSVLEQTYPNIELIVLDDGSRDNTPKILADLQQQAAANGKPFTFIAKKNSGLSDTLNQALAMATGKYICQFGSDDIMLPDKTATQVAFMEANPDVAVCGGNAINIDSDGVIITRRQKSPPQREITFEHLFANTGHGIVASTCMIRKDVLDREGGWNPAIPLEDMYMWFKLTSRGYRMVGLGVVLMHYRKHANNSYKNVRYMYESMMKTIADYREHSLYPQVHLSLLRGYFLTAAKHDKKLAKEILADIPLRAFNKKVWRGLFYLLKP
jgi:alpha-1,3-rhamnosyltransferase